MAEEESKPWHQQPGETATFFHRFHQWLTQKKPRSLLAVYNEERAQKGTGKANYIPHSWNDIREKFQWDHRALAWDRAEQERLDRELAEQRAEERRSELEIAQRLRAKALKMLSLPTVEKVIKRKGQEMVCVLVPDWRNPKAASDLYAEAKEHARAALEMNDKRLLLDLRKLSDEELYDLLARTFEGETEASSPNGVSPAQGNGSTTLH